MDLLDTLLENHGMGPFHPFAASSTMVLWDVRCEDEAKFIRVVNFRLSRRLESPPARFRELVIQYFLARAADPGVRAILRENLELMFCCLV